MTCPPPTCAGRAAAACCGSCRCATCWGCCARTPTCTAAPAARRCPACTLTTWPSSTRRAPAPAGGVPVLFIGLASSHGLARPTVGPAINHILKLALCGFQADNNAESAAAAAVALRAPLQSKPTAPSTSAADGSVRNGGAPPVPSSPFESVAGAATPRGAPQGGAGRGGALGSRHMSASQAKFSSSKSSRRLNS